MNDKIIYNIPLKAMSTSKYYYEGRKRTTLGKDYDRDVTACLRSRKTKPPINRRWHYRIHIWTFHPIDYFYNKNGTLYRFDTNNFMKPLEDIFKRFTGLDDCNNVDCFGSKRPANKDGIRIIYSWTEKTKIYKLP